MVSKNVPKEKIDDTKSVFNRLIYNLVEKLVVISYLHGYQKLKYKILKCGYKWIDRLFEL